MHSILFLLLHNLAYFTENLHTTVIESIFSLLKFCEDCWQKAGEEMQDRLIYEESILQLLKFIEVILKFQKTQNVELVYMLIEKCSVLSRLSQGIMLRPVVKKIERVKTKH